MRVRSTTMILEQWNSLILWVLLASARALSLPPDSIGVSSHQHINNISYAGEILSGLASIFSPRMDFDQWKPLTGRGDPLRNDPTYDYEPPVLERVHYWADDTRPDREHYPERKSEVLMLGVSSRKPSVTSRPPPPQPPARRQQHQRPSPVKYEDFTFKINEHYPMTILVPPPPPPPGLQPQLFLLNDEKMSPSNFNIPRTEAPVVITQGTSVPEHLTSLYALQEANLIYQSSTTHQNWILNTNQTKTPLSGTVSSDYAGWGPTTPLDDIEGNNETHNLITSDHIELTKQPYKFYRPMLSEAPPPPSIATPSPLRQPTFLPTVLPPTVLTETTTNKVTHTETWPTEKPTYDINTENLDYYEDTTTEKYIFEPTLNPPEINRPEASLFDMLGPMLSMPLPNGPERLEDNLYAHASENNQVYKKQTPEDILKLRTMQTMQPPPITELVETTTNNNYKQSYHPNAHDLNSILLNGNNKPSLHTPDPYLHMRFTPPVTTPMPTQTKSSTEATSVPMYLIIQGHSKVKTYSSKAKPNDETDSLKNEIPNPNETTEVKHLHPIKDKHPKKMEKVDLRTSRAYNLSSLIDQGLGSIEIQEADVGIKYDVSDGSNVPVEIYRKGIVDSDENNYASSDNKQKIKRLKRQIDLEDLLPFDEDSIEEYVYNFFEGKKNETGITGLIAQAVTSDTATIVDELEDDNDATVRRR